MIAQYARLIDFNSSINKKELYMLLKCTVQMDFNIIKQVHLFYYSDYMYATSSNSRGSKISG